MGKDAMVKLYDTTLRDGTQSEDISFQVADKIRIAQKLDELGIHYIEGGWPGSNPKDIAFFKEIKKETLKQAKIAAFGSTRRAKTTPDKDNNIRTLIQAEPDTVTIFGKTWDFHVREALRISLEENLELINETSCSRCHEYARAEAIKNALSGMDSRIEAVAADLERQRRTRSDQRHVALEDIPELRQFVDRQAADYAAYARYARILF